MPATLFRSRLYFIADTAVPFDGSLVSCVQAAVAGGAGLVQYRASEPSTRAMVDTAVALVQHCRKAGVPLVVRGRVDVALAATADGVHLEAGDMPVALARRLMGPHAIVGVTVHSLADAREAVRQGASFVAVGPIFATSDMPGVPVGLDAVQQLTQVVALPVCALGGIDLSNIEALSHTPAALIAVSSALTSAQNTRAVAQNLVQRLQVA